MICDGRSASRRPKVREPRSAHIGDTAAGSSTEFGVAERRSMRGPTDWGSAPTSNGVQTWHGKQGGDL